MKSSRERLSVNYAKDMGYDFAQNYGRIWNSVGKVNDSILLERSLLLVLVNVEFSYWNSSGERPYVKNTEQLQNAGLLVISHETSVCVWLGSGK